MRPFSSQAFELATTEAVRRRRGGKRLATIVVVSGALLLALATPVVALG